MCCAPSDERTGLLFTTAAVLRQRSHSRVQVPWDSWPHFVVSDSKLPQAGGPGTHIDTLHPSNRAAPGVPPGNGFPFCRLLLLAGLRWRYSNPPPRKDWISPCWCWSSPITVAPRPKAWTFFTRSNTEGVGSNPTRGMDVCVCLFCLCCPVYRQRPCDGLIPRPRSPTDYVTKRLSNWEIGHGQTKGCRATDEWMNVLKFRWMTQNRNR
jgi:hypothetical protein